MNFCFSLSLTSEVIHFVHYGSCICRSREDCITVVRNLNLTRGKKTFFSTVLSNCIFLWQCRVWKTVFSYIQIFGNLIDQLTSMLLYTTYCCFILDPNAYTRLSLKPPVNWIHRNCCLYTLKTCSVLLRLNLYFMFSFKDYSQFITISVFLWLIN